MKNVLVILALLLSSPIFSQESFENETDTSEWYGPYTSIDSTIIWHLDTMAGTNRSANTPLIINYLQSVLGKKVGDGLCGTLGEKLCTTLKLKESPEVKITMDQVKSLSIGDFITMPQFLEFYGPTGEAWGHTNTLHLCVFLGMKDDNTMLVAEQNATGNTYNTYVQINEVRIDRIRFFKGNNHEPYFLVSRLD